MKLVSDYIEKLSQSASKHREQIDILKYIVKLNNWYAYKLETELQLQKKLSGDKTNDTIITEMIDKNIESIASLKVEYCDIWEKYYKPDNLNLIEDKFDRLTSYFKEVKDQISAGAIKSPLIESKWIYADKTDSLPVKKARFSKSFNIKGTPGRSYLQLIADSYASLFINGRYVDRVFAKRSLSLSSEYKRVKMLEITPYLHDGQNEISVEAECFNSKISTGINVIATISDEEGSKILKSDKAWKSEDNSGKSEPVFTTEKKYLFEIVAPDFKTLRPSWIER